MPAMLTELVARAPAATAMVEARGSISWAALADRVNRWIGVLRGHGIAAGDAVAVMAGNRRESIEAVLACLHAGVTTVPVSWHLTASEVTHILADADCRLLVVDEARAAVAAAALASLAERSPRPPIALVIGQDAAATGAPPGFLPVEPALAGASPDEPPGQQCGTVLLYTSGSTGRPKGVVTRFFVAGAPFDRVRRLGEYADQTLRMPSDGRTLLVAPWYHSAQLFFALLSLLRGCCLVVLERFDAAETLSTMVRQRITAAHFVPTHFVRLLTLDRSVRERLRPTDLRVVWHGGGPCPVEVKRRMIEWWGPVLLEYYGATEAGAVTVIDSAEALRRPGSVGRAVPPNRIVVVDDRGRPLPPGRPGLVYVERSGTSGFRYHNAPRETAAAHLAPGLFTVGEVGYLDGDGYLYLTGRARDVAVTGGMNVQLAEVEAALLTHPDVRDAAALAVPDPEYGERVVAVVVPADHTDTTDLPARLDRHCRRSLAGFKVPRGYRLVATLPRDDAGKLRKELVRRTLTAVPGGIP